MPDGLFIDCNKHGKLVPAMLICKHVDPDSLQKRSVSFEDHDTALCHECFHDQDPDKMGFVCLKCFREKGIQ